MSFGFSIGDFLAVGSLVTDIIKSLKDSGGAKSEYQELLRELECLEKTLHWLDRLEAGGGRSQNLDSIKFAALSCRRTLEDFLGRVKKYDTSLGVWSKDAGLKTTSDKLKWSLGKKDEIAKLQAYLNIHVGTINMLLMEYGFEVLHTSSERVTASQLRIHERLEETSRIVAEIQNNTNVQKLAIASTQSMVSRLSEIVTGELYTSWRTLVDMVAKVCVSTQQIYVILLEIKDSVSSVDTRWTFFQEPWLVEDALGGKFPVPSEYSVDLFKDIIRSRFKDGPGSREVMDGHFELVKTKDSRHEITQGSRVPPGTMITMAIVLDGPHSLVPGGGSRCSACNVWFGESSKTEPSSEKVADVIRHHIKGEKNSEGKHTKSTNLMDLTISKAHVLKEVQSFRNVRLVRRTFGLGSDGVTKIYLWFHLMRMGRSEIEFIVELQPKTLRQDTSVSYGGLCLYHGYQFFKIYDKVSPGPRWGENII